MGTAGVGVLVGVAFRVAVTVGDGRPVMVRTNAGVDVAVAVSSTAAVREPTRGRNNFQATSPTASATINVTAARNTIG